MVTSNSCSLPPLAPRRGPLHLLNAANPPNANLAVEVVVLIACPGERPNSRRGHFRNPKNQPCFVLEYSFGAKTIPKFILEICREYRIFRAFTDDGVVVRCLSFLESAIERESERLPCKKDAGGVGMPKAARTIIVALIGGTNATGRAIVVLRGDVCTL